jgi:hypothetical protein
MAIYAVVPSSGGVVSNTVAGDNVEEVKSIVGDVVEVTEETGPAGIGFTWDGTVFTPPTE